jgi:hypothetical protein
VQLLIICKNEASLLYKLHKSITVPNWNKPLAFGAVAVVSGGLTVQQEVVQVRLIGPEQLHQLDPVRLAQEHHPQLELVVRSSQGGSMAGGQAQVAAVLFNTAQQASLALGQRQQEQLLTLSTQQH